MSAKLGSGCKQPQQWDTVRRHWVRSEHETISLCGWMARLQAACGLVGHLDFRDGNHLGISFPRMRPRSKHRKRKQIIISESCILGAHWLIAERIPITLQQIHHATRAMAGCCCFVSNLLIDSRSPSGPSWPPAGRTKLGVLGVFGAVWGTSTGT